LITHYTILAVVNQCSAALTTYFVTSSTMPDLQSRALYASDTMNNVSANSGISLPYRFHS